MTVAPPHEPTPSPSPLAPSRAAAPGRGARLALAALLLATMTLTGSGGGGVAPAEAGVAPACTYGDVLTRYRAQGDWYRSLLDTRYRLSRVSAPTDLVAANRSGAWGSGYVRRIALADLTAMYRAARAAGAPFAIQSAYRSYSSQVSTFNMWVRKVGYSRALLASARPGHSEHQLGTVVDLKTPGGAAPWYYADWAATRAGAWLARNAWRYGWVMSYPKNKSPWATCYKYEPWHYRYVGRTIAAKIRSSTLAPRQWLYLKGATTTWTGGLPSPTPTPRPTPSPTTAPSPTPSEAPSISPSATPSEVPTESPSEAPPTDSPTASPSEAPSQAPTSAPTDAPTESPAP